MPVYDSAEEMVAVELEEKISRLEADVAKLNDENLALRRDFRILNDLMNEAANEEDFCSRYDELVKDWSNQLEMATLVGRVHDWEVPVKFAQHSDRQFFVYPVKATSKEAAAEEVRNWSSDKIIENLLGRGYFTSFSVIEENVRF